MLLHRVQLGRNVDIREHEEESKVLPADVGECRDGERAAVGKPVGAAESVSPPCLQTQSVKSSFKRK